MGTYGDRGASSPAASSRWAPILLEKLKERIAPAVHQNLSSNAAARELRLSLHWNGVLIDRQQQRVAY